MPVHLQHRDGRGARARYSSVTRTLMQWVPASSRRPKDRLGSALTHGFLVAWLRAKHFLDEEGSARVRTRRALADPILYAGAGAAVEHVDHEVGRPGIVLRDRRADELAHAHAVAALLAARCDSLSRTIRTCRAFGSFAGWNRVVARLPSTVSMKSVGRAVVAVRDRDAAVIVGPAPPRARHRRHHMMMVERPSPDRDHRRRDSDARWCGCAPRS